MNSASRSRLSKVHQCQFESLLFDEVGQKRTSIEEAA
jgi:hypothetical protein